MDNIVTWLHISDLHAFPQRDGDHTAYIIKGLIEDAQKVVRDNGLRPDFLFFTGDAAFGHLNENESSIIPQLKSARSFLKRLQTAFPEEIPDSRLFMVPGNHDINRHTINSQQRLFLRSSDAKVSKEVENEFKSGGKMWQEWMNRLGHYRSFLETENLLHLLQDPDRLIYSAPVILPSGLRVSVSGLNTAWSCGDDDAKGILRCAGETQLLRLLSIRGDSDLSIALLHHPATWFENHEGKWDRFLDKEFDFCLYGHEHDSWITPAEGALAKSFYSGATFQGKDQNGYGYFIVRLDLDTGEGTVWPRCYGFNNHQWMANLDLPGLTGGCRRFDCPKLPKQEQNQLMVVRQPMEASALHWQKVMLSGVRCKYAALSPAMQVRKEDGELQSSRPPNLRFALQASISGGGVIAVEELNQLAPSYHVITLCGARFSGKTETLERLVEAQAFALTNQPSGRLVPIFVSLKDIVASREAFIGISKGNRDMASFEWAFDLLVRTAAPNDRNLSAVVPFLESLTALPNSEVIERDMLDIFIDDADLVREEIMQASYWFETILWGMEQGRVHRLWLGGGVSLARVVRAAAVWSVELLPIGDEQVHTSVKGDAKLRAWAKQEQVLRLLRCPMVLDRTLVWRESGVTTRHIDSRALANHSRAWLTAGMEWDRWKPLKLRGASVVLRPPHVLPPGSDKPIYGRDEMVERLRFRLVPGCVEFLVGDGGMGKTSLAREAAKAIAPTPARLADSLFPDGIYHFDLYRHYHDHPDQEDDAINAALRRLAEDFGVKDGGPVVAAANALRGAAALIIVEGAECAGDRLRDTLDCFVPADSRCGLLITSRDRKQALKWTNLELIEVGELPSNAVANAVLNDRSGRTWTAEQTELIVQVVGLHAIVIELVGAALQDIELDEFEAWLEELGDHPFDFLGDELRDKRINVMPSVSRYSRTLSKAEQPQPLRILAIMGMLGSEPASEGWLGDALQTDLRGVRRDLQGLARKGLVRQTEDRGVWTFPHATLAAFARGPEITASVGVTENLQAYRERLLESWVSALENPKETQDRRKLVNYGRALWPIFGGSPFRETQLQRMADALHAALGRQSADDEFGVQSAAAAGKLLLFLLDECSSSSGTSVRYRQRAEALHWIANGLEAEGEIDAALAKFDEALLCAKEATKLEPTDGQYRRELSVALSRVSQLYGDYRCSSRDLGRRLDLKRQAMVAIDEAISLSPSKAWFQEDRCSDWIALSHISPTDDEKEVAATKAYELGQTLATDYPTNPYSLVQAMWACENLAAMLHKQGDEPGAIEKRTEALNFANQAAGTPETNLPARIAQITANRVLANSFNFDQPEQSLYLREALRLARLLILEHPRSRAVAQSTIQVIDMSLNIELEGEVPSSLKLERHKLQSITGEVDFQALTRLGESMIVQGSYEQAREAFDQALTGAERLVDEWVEPAPAIPGEKPVSAPSRTDLLADVAIIQKRLDALPLREVQPQKRSKLVSDHEAWAQELMDPIQTTPRAFSYKSSPNKEVGEDGGLPGFDPVTAEAFFRDLISRYKVEDDQIIMDLVSFHPLTQFEEREFVDLLMGSLALNLGEKKRVVDAVPTLSQHQVDELKKVFVEEVAEYEKLMPKEGETIRWLQERQAWLWRELKLLYIKELKDRQKANEEGNRSEQFEI